MRNISVPERAKGGLQGELIGGHLALATTKESNLGDLRSMTVNINRGRIGEACR